MEFDSRATSCNIALHALLVCEVIRTDTEQYETWFRFGGQFIRFSRYEYALVTGLRFGQPTFDPLEHHVPPRGGVYHRHFAGLTVKVDALRALFTADPFGMVAADALKLAKILLFYCLLMGVDGKSYSVEAWVWELVEDEECWESFPWGAYTYKNLFHYICEVPTTLGQ